MIVAAAAAPAPATPVAGCDAKNRTTPTSKSASNEQIRAGRATQGAPRTSRRLREGPPTGKTKTPESMNRRT